MSVPSRKDETRYSLLDFLFPPFMDGSSLKWMRRYGDKPLRDNFSSPQRALCLESMYLSVLSLFTVDRISFVRCVIFPEFWKWNAPPSDDSISTPVGTRRIVYVPPRPLYLSPCSHHNNIKWIRSPLCLGTWAFTAMSLEMEACIFHSPRPKTKSFPLSQE